ncbi:MAG: MotA/TolQ/ExbB proton channel family protein [Gammaproteobacteria bacterium]|nr:MotA/TolQ/ExbB proton channel family protein [Gammaproteobacteria bacterium]
MKRRSRIAALAIAAILAGHFAAPAAAGELDQLLERIEQTQAADAKLRREREQRFRAANVEQKQLLDALRAQVATEQVRGDELKTRFDSNEAELQQLEQALQARTGELGELFGTVRQTAKDLAALVAESPASANAAERVALLEQLGESKVLPDIAKLHAMWRALQRATVETGRVVRESADVVASNGEAARAEIVRIGEFAALHGADYLRYEPAGRRFVVLPRQPVHVDAATLAALHDGAPGYLPLTIDPTRGALMGMLVDTPTWSERLQQGGVVGYTILAVGAIGLLIVFVRMLYLGRVHARMRRQLRDLADPRDDNPLGRVLQVARQAEAADPANLELQIDEAVLRELPRLTRGEGLLKLLAGVAPLLGLLGTVVGMIVTFQAISLFGTGDPKLMANGISQALVTTALGLIVAIPLLFLHTLLAARGRTLTQLLDQQSLGLAIMARE